MFYLCWKASLGELRSWPSCGSWALSAGQTVECKLWPRASLQWMDTVNRSWDWEVGSDILIQQSGSFHSLPDALFHGVRDLREIPHFLPWEMRDSTSSLCSRCTLETSMQPGLCILSSKLRHSPAALLLAGFSWKSEVFPCFKFGVLECDRTNSSLWIPCELCHINWPVTRWFTADAFLVLVFVYDFFFSWADRGLIVGVWELVPSQRFWIMSILSKYVALALELEIRHSNTASWPHFCYCPLTAVLWHIDLTCHLSPGLYCQWPFRITGE